MDNVVLPSPHAASATEGGGEASYRLVGDFILDLSRSRRPRSIVNLEVKPRWKFE